MRLSRKTVMVSSSRCYQALFASFPTFFSHHPHRILVFMPSQEKRFDIVSELPLEIVVECIVPRIIEYDGTPFMLHERRNYFAVCTTWCKRICANDSLHFHLECDWLLSSVDWIQVQAVAPYIRTISITAESEEELYKLVRYAHFSSLRHLKIKGNGGTDV